MDLELQKQQVRYWSKMASLALTLLPPLLRWQKEPNPFTQDWKQTSLKSRVLIIGGVCLLLVILSYYLNYYTISSVFWPEPLIPNELNTISPLWNGIVYRDKRTDYYKPTLKY